MNKRLRILTCLACLLAACEAPGDLERSISDDARAAPPPRIAPLGSLLNGPEPRLTEDEAEQLLNRGRSAAARASDAF